MNGRDDNQIKLITARDVDAAETRSGSYPRRDVTWSSVEGSAAAVIWTYDANEPPRGWADMTDDEIDAYLDGCCDD